MAELDLDLSVLTQMNKKPSEQIGKKVMYTMPRNPADKTTIVSVFPKMILENKTTIWPNRYEIPAADKDGFALLVVEGASYYMPSSIEKMAPTEIQINSAELARSIVEDYLTGMWLASKGNRGPGVFWIPGEWDHKTILNYKEAKTGKTFDQFLSEARAQQKEWFKLLVDAADSLWASSGGNPRAIPVDSKLGAEMLGVDKTKPWMQNDIAASLEHCPSCGEMINLNYPVCKYCHAIVNPAKAKELDLQFSAR